MSDFLYGRQIHPVEYLESTGTQYIDTGFTPNQNTKTELDYKITTDLSSGFPLFGSRTSASSKGYSYQRYGSGVMGGQYGSNITHSNISPDLNRHIIIRDKNKIYLDGTEIASNPTSTFTCPGNLYLNAMNNNGTATIQNVGVAYYGMKIYDNDVLVRDFIPAIDSDGVGYMFDRVSHKIFDNAGTGAFKYPAREVEYLTSDGNNQYIDTGIQPTDDYGYKIRNTYTRGGGEQCAIGCMDTGNRFVGIYTSGSENQLSGAWGSFVGFLPTFAWATGDILDVEVNYKNSRKMIVNGTELKDISDVHISGTISNTLYLFARHYGGTITKMKGNVYGVEITNGQNIVADFIPAFKDGQIGMYDKVSGVLKTNTGTGTFTIGKIVEPEYE